MNEQTKTNLLAGGMFLAAVAGVFGQPTITQQPENQTASLFADAIFRVSVTGDFPFGYQWRFNDSDITGMTNWTLTVTNVQHANAGNYNVVVTNPSGSVTSQVATLTITPFNSVYCFGFSWTDTQAISHDGTMRTTPYNNPLYWEDRASNGPMWPEFVSTNLGLAYLAAHNYARGGSSLSDTLNQVVNFPVPPKPQLSLYCLWLGNTADITSEATWNQSIQSDILVNSNAVNRLYAKGARTIVIESQFDQDPTERRFFGNNIALRSRYHDYFARFNAGFIDAMNKDSQAKPDLRFLFVDVFSRLDDVLANPAPYGFTKTDIGAVDDTALTNKSFAGSGADYVFWDNFHPSTKLHELIATWHLEALTNSILEKLDVTIVGGSPCIQMNHLQIGRDYTLQKSTELKTWTAVQSFTASAGTNQWSSPFGNDSTAYFRLKWER